MNIKTEMSGLRYIRALLTAVYLLLPATPFAQMILEDPDYVIKNPRYQDPNDNVMSYSFRDDYHDYYYQGKIIDSLGHGFSTAITRHYYYCVDSVIPHKKPDEIETQWFNPQHKRLLTVDADSNKVKDSNRIMYNWFAASAILAYETKDSLGISLKDAEFFTYDGNNRCIGDSTHYYWKDYGAEEVIHTQYDKGDTVYYNINIRGYYKHKDTSTFLMLRLDSGKTESCWETSRGRYFEREYHIYNANNKEILSAEVNARDSGSTTTRYDNKGRFAERNSYERGQLSELKTYTYNNQGVCTETDENLSTADAFSCPNNDVTVTVRDSNGNQYSKVTTKEEAGKPLTTTVINKYTFKHGKITIDSTFSDEEGFLYSEAKQSVEVLKYDKHYNVIEVNDDDGDENGGTTKRTWKYDEHNKMLEYCLFSTCNDTVPIYIIRYTYYPGSNVVKMAYKMNGNETDIHYFSSDGRIVKNIHAITDKALSGQIWTDYNITTYEYK